MRKIDVSKAVFVFDTNVVFLMLKEFLLAAKLGKVHKINDFASGIIVTIDIFTFLCRTLSIFLPNSLKNMLCRSRTIKATRHRASDNALHKLSPTVGIFMPSNFDILCFQVWL